MRFIDWYLSTNLIKILICLKNLLKYMEYSIKTYVDIVAGFAHFSTSGVAVSFLVIILLCLGWFGFEKSDLTLYSNNSDPFKTPEKDILKGDPKTTPRAPGGRVSENDRGNTPKVIKGKSLFPKNDSPKKK